MPRPRISPMSDLPRGSPLLAGCPAMCNRLRTTVASGARLVKPGSGPPGRLGPGQGSLAVCYTGRRFMPPSSNRRAESRRLRVGSAAVTLRDVARAANVAQSTVSRALAADPRISVATRRAVQQVARRLGYAPNAFARGLAGGGADVVGGVITRTAEYTFASGFHLALLKGISRVLQDAGYLLLLSFLEKRDYVALHRSGLCRGVIVLMSRIGDRQVAALRRRVPAVLIPGDPALPGIASVNFDVAVPVALAMRRLLEIGHRRIGFIGGAPDSLFHRDRLSAFERVLGEAGVAPDPAL